MSVDEKTIHDHILRLATDTAIEPITTSAGGIVSITMDTTIRVTAVKIHEPALSEEQRSRLEHAIAEAVNSAVKEAAAARTKHLMELVKRSKP
jgi:DNA-binding protein YbaB